MAYVKYTDLYTPNQVLEKMVEYIKSRGYTVVQDLVDDTNVYDRASVDGKKFVFHNRDSDYFIHLRSFNKISPFGVADDDAMDEAEPDIDKGYCGIAMTISEGYSPSQRWYYQYNVPLKKNTTTVCYTCMPIVDRTGHEPYVLYCNNIISPSDTLMFTVALHYTEADDEAYWDRNEYKCVHMVVGDLTKYDTWTGGIYFSASAVPSTVINASEMFDPENDKDVEDVHDSAILPILSSGSISNTFLRIDIDDAPSASRGNIRWASSGTDNMTGKRLSIPVRVGNSGNGDIPSYYNIQSHSKLDWGRDINTLNCVTLNLPLYMAVLVDPDVLEVYSGVGQVCGLYYCCLLNMQSTFCYEMSYPQSKNLCQVFSPSMRRGKYGFDGISVRQLEEDTTLT